jgi:hypothetical protein
VASKWDPPFRIGDRLFTPALVPHVALNGPDVYPLFEKVSCVTVAEGMDGNFFLYPCFFYCTTQGSLYAGSVHRNGRGRSPRMFSSKGGKEECGISMCFPI